MTAPRLIKRTPAHQYVAARGARIAHPCDGLPARRARSLVCAVARGFATLTGDLPAESPPPLCAIGSPTPSLVCSSCAFSATGIGALRPQFELQLRLGAASGDGIGELPHPYRPRPSRRLMSWPQTMTPTLIARTRPSTTTAKLDRAASVMRT